MKPWIIQTADFIKSAPSLKDAPHLNEIPEIVMVGRSNVGKSSLINTLLGRKNLAKTSNTPGKTRLINFYKIVEKHHTFALVDLPGYGYAKVSKEMQAQWQKTLTHYLKNRQHIRLVLQLIDARHGFQPNDLQMAAWLAEQALPTLVVLTKTDKLKKAEVVKSFQHTLTQTSLGEEQILLFSAQSGQGKPQLQQAINHFITLKSE